MDDKKSHELYMRNTLPLLKEEFLSIHKDLQECKPEDGQHYQSRFLGAYEVLSTVVNQMKVFGIDPKEHGFDIDLDDYI